MEFIEGFAWPVPRALAGAVSACRFELGDVIYSDAQGYEAWPGGRKNLGFALQILDPPKTARALAGEAEGKRFDANWGSPVELELSDFAAGATRGVETTQGRLFTCLWRGDPGCLDPGGEPPAPPLSQRALHQRLEEAVDAFADGFRGPETGGHGFCLYLSAVDDANDTARGKARAVEAALAEKFDVRSRVLSPGEAGLADSQSLHPALRVWGVAIDASKPGPIEDRLRGLLYGGAGEAGRFALARHGLLVQVGPA